MKLSSLFMAASMLAVSAVPAFAFNWYPQPMGATVNNTAYVNSSAESMSGTGMNNISSAPAMPTFHFWMPSAPTMNSIVSGSASSTAQSAVGGVNLTDTLMNLKTVNNFAKINSSAEATSLTGMNSILGGSGTNMIKSGNAGSSSLSQVTNINVTGFGM